MWVADASGDWVLDLESRKPRRIANIHCPKKPSDGDRIQVGEFIAEYRRVIHRPTGPTPAYNCHGLTFACRRTQIVDPNEVELILVEDGYRKLELNEQIIGGDVAIWRQGCEIVHSGIVCYLSSEGVPWILSKWSRYHEAIHNPFDCPYKDGTVVSYYRLGRYEPIVIR